MTCILYGMRTEAQGHAGLQERRLDLDPDSLSRFTLPPPPRLPPNTSQTFQAALWSQARESLSGPQFPHLPRKNCRSQWGRPLPIGPRIQAPATVWPRLGAC